LASGFWPRGSATFAGGCDRASLTFRQLPLYDYESLAHFVQQGIEPYGCQHLLRIDHDVAVWARKRPGEANCLSQATLQAISLNGASQSAPYGESDAQTRNCRNSSIPNDLPVQVENSHGCREMPAPQLVYTLKIGVA
jgi:hypothetical protein